MKKIVVVGLIVVLGILFIVQNSDARWRRKKVEKQPQPTEPVVMKTIALGDVNVGNSGGGQQAYEVKETIQMMLKKEIEKKGKGRFNVIITSPAVVVEGSQPDASKMPTISSKPTQAEIMKYMAQMQQFQKQMSGQVKVHKPVTADAYFEFSVADSQGGMSASGIPSEIGQFVDVPVSIGSMSAKSSKIQLICTMREPASGQLLDRYAAKASSVRVQNIMGYSSYDYGDDAMTRESLFKSAVRKCGKWIVDKAK